jgi:hypothetical protein
MEKQEAREKMGGADFCPYRPLSQDRNVDCYANAWFTRVWFLVVIMIMAVTVAMIMIVVVLVPTVVAFVIVIPFMVVLDAAM